MVSYSPRDVCIVDFSRTDTGDPKPRPALVVSAAKFNKGGDVVVLPISHSADPQHPFVHEISAVGPDFRKTGLQKVPSSVRWTKPYAVPKKIIDRKIGRVDDATFAAVCDKLKTVFDA
ncbi:MAG: type II toxin-antitoxin system PemK/MazF family toxin [Planctomycetales bacterium]